MPDNLINESIFALYLDANQYILARAFIESPVSKFTTLSQWEVVLRTTEDTEHTRRYRIDCYSHNTRRFCDTSYADNYKTALKMFIERLNNWPKMNQA